MKIQKEEKKSTKCCILNGQGDGSSSVELEGRGVERKTENIGRPKGWKNYVCRIYEVDIREQQFSPSAIYVSTTTKTVTMLQIVLNL